MKKMPPLSRLTIALLFFSVASISMAVDLEIGKNNESTEESNVISDDSVGGLGNENLKKSSSNKKSDSPKDKSHTFASARSVLVSGSTMPEQLNPRSSPALHDINQTLRKGFDTYGKEKNLPLYQKFLIGSGVLGFIIALLNLILTFIHRSEDKAKSIIDDFWLREIIIPRAIEPIEEKILKNPFRYQDLTRLKANEIDRLVKSLDELKYSLSIADIISNDLLICLEESLDELLIIVATRSMPGQVYSINGNAVNNSSVGDPFFNCYKAMLFQLIETHKRFNVKNF